MRCPVEPASDMPEYLSCSGGGYWSINQCGHSAVDKDCAEMSKVIRDIVINLSIHNVSLIDGQRGTWLGSGNGEIIVDVGWVYEGPVTIACGQH